MNRDIFALMLLFFCVNFSFAQEKFTAEIGTYQNIQVKQNSDIEGVASVEFADNAYPDHLALICAVESQAESLKHTIVFDYNEGMFAHKFKISDIDNDGDDELLVWYMKGNHGHYLKVFEISSDDKSAKPEAWSIIFIGDSWDAEIKDGKIICYSFVQDKAEKIVSATYLIKKDSAELIEEAKLIYLLLFLGVIILLICLYKIFQKIKK